ncbi:TonB-dependent receptor [Thalassobellus suaedae]|uniref:TonB-dependent receptor n=1 Tax=Thalassobellus suaedae TaxID=3074124 RepID=A0ABY9Y684_9FLAO|nr:TonB-dependent receptor [Flavobacteriaceae bacterium HL-DH10]
MKKNYALSLFITMISFLTFAQEGNIQGVVIDNDGLQVPFSNILIESLNKGAYSDVDGNFLLLEVPAGNQAITVKYLGYEDAKMDVMVQDGKTSTVTITIKPKALALDDIVINGFNSGQAKALNAQKNKQNITNIVSTDQIGKFPDANIGDAVKRIPGITMQVDQGEARNVIIRGLAPQLNSVTLNGSRIPSAEGDNRNVQMDLIPSDMIQLIEVNKAVTPDMDADALGGSVNLVTRTSPNGYRVSATLGSGVNFITNKKILNGSFLVGGKSENKKFGWMLSTSINDNDFGSDNVEAVWVNEAENMVGDDVEVKPYIEESDIRTYLVERIRRSFSANFDYAFDANNTIYLKTMYNWRDDRENRYRLRYKKIEAELDASDNIIGYTGEIDRQTKGGIDSNRNKNARLEDQRMQNYSLGGNHLLGTLEMDWMTSFSTASEERLNERYISYRVKDVALNEDLSDTEFPLLTPVNASDVDFSEFGLKEITEENQYTDEKDFNAFVNFKLPVNFFNTNDGFIKFGGRSKVKNKERENNFFEYAPLNSAFDDLTALPLIDQTDSDYLAGSKYAAGQFVDNKFLGSLDLNNASLFEVEDVPSEYARANYKVKEYVYAGYFMANQKISNKFSVLAGLRVEGTKTKATGNQIEDEEDILGTITKEKDYAHILPGVHLKYNLNDRTVLRFAWTNTLARPNYADIVPNRDVITDDEEIVLGNPDLSATTSMNFDVMAEHYFKNVGIISGGLFQKGIKDFIYTYQYEDTATGFDVFQPQNGDDASIFGAEVNFQRQLDFLPGFAKNFSIMVNYTYLTSNADGIRNSDGEERSDLDLPGTAPNMFNGSLAYTSNRLSLRLSANYSDSYIDEIGGNAFEDRYYGEQFLVDFNGSYKIGNGFSAYFSLNNITDQPLRYFQGVKARTMQMEYYGRRLTFGLKYDLFKKK